MDVLNETNIDIQNQLDTDTIKSEYSKMIKNDKNYLSKKIYRVISSKNNKIDLSFIERIMDTYLGFELEFRGLYTIDKISKEILKKYKFINDKSLTENFNKKELFQSYKNAIKKILEENQMTWINNATEDFTEQLKIEIKLYLNKSESKENINIILKSMPKELETIFSEYESKFKKEYETILIQFISKKLIQIKELLINAKMDEEEKERLKEYSQIINLSNHNLIIENDIIYIQDKITKEKSRLIFDGIKLKSTDDAIIYIVDNNTSHYGYINNKNKIRILIIDERIDIVIPSNKKESSENKTIISFKKKNHNFEFYYNSKQVKNLKNIHSIIYIIKKYTPEIYNKMMNDSDFQTLLIDIQRYYSQQDNNNQKEISTNMLIEDSEQKEVSKSNKPSR